MSHKYRPKGVNLVERKIGSNGVYAAWLIFLLISLLINIPYIFIFKIESSAQVNTNETIVILKPDIEVMSNPIWLNSIAIVYFLKDSFSIFLICSFNLKISIGLRKRSFSLNKDENQNSNSLSSTSRRKERKVSYMILLLCIFLFASNISEPFYRIKRKLNLLFFTKFNYLGYYLAISNIISFLCSYFKLFIYLIFSKTFLRQFKKSFLSIQLEKWKKRTKY